MPTPHRAFTNEPLSIQDCEVTLEWSALHRQYEPIGTFTDPKDWPDKKKWMHILIVAGMTMATPLGSTIHAPAIVHIAHDFSIDAGTAALTVQLYVLGFAIAPFLFLPLSKIYGRLYMYHAASLLLLLGHLGCALTPTFGVLLAFRFLAGCGGACAITQGSGTIADIIEKERRGRAVAVMAFGTVWAPTLGPIVGGRVAESLGWRACFWVLVCVVAFNGVVAWFYMEETSTTHTICVYQRLSAEEAKSPLLSTPTEEDNLPSHPLVTPLWRVFVGAILAPFRLLRYPLFGATTLLTALFYSIQIYLYIDIPATYNAVYGFTPSQTGFAFLGTGVGMTLGLLAFGLLSDRCMAILAAGGERKPEHRLPLMLISAVLVSLGLAVYSLAASASVHWIFPILGNGLIGCGLYSISAGAATFLIDLYPQRAAESATLLSVIRFPIGALISASGARLVLYFGRTVIQGAFAILALHAIPAIYLLYRMGSSFHAKHHSV